jgi:hypothetical protein
MLRPGRPAGLLPWLLVPVLAAVSLWPLSAYRLDDAFITHRTARNLAAGHGLVYTPGEGPTLATSSPGFALLLAGLTRATGLEPPALAWALAILATAAAGLLLHRLLSRFLPPAAALAGALLLVSNPILARSTGLETPLYLVAILAVLLALERRRFLAAGLWTGAALWLRLDAAALAAPALLVWARAPAGSRAAMPPRAGSEPGAGGETSARRPTLPGRAGSEPGAGTPSRRPTVPAWRGIALRGRRPGELVVCLGAAALLVLPWVLWAWRRYGTFVPDGLAAKRAGGAIVSGATGYDLFARGLWRLPRELVAESAAFLLWVPLAALGLLWLARHRPRPAGALALWALAYFAAFELAGLPWRHVWYWAPLQLPLVVAGAAGVEALDGAVERLRPAGRRLLFGAGVLALLGGLLSAQVASARRSPELPLRAAAYRELGAVLRCAPGERLAAWEVGILGYYSGCPMLDLAGIVSPEVRALGPEEALARARPRWCVDVRPPGYVPRWSAPIRGGGEVVVYVDAPLVLID